MKTLELRAINSIEVGRCSLDKNHRLKLNKSR